MNKLARERWLLGMMLFSLFLFSHVLGTQFHNWSKIYPFFHWSLFSNTPAHLSNVQLRVIHAGNDCLLHLCKPTFEGKEILEIYGYLREQQKLQGTDNPDIEDYLQASFRLDFIGFISKPLGYIELAKSLKMNRADHDE